MATVEITCGAYGHREPGARRVVIVRAGDAPIEVSDAEAARLIDLGVAKSVSADGFGTSGKPESEPPAKPKKGKPEGKPKEDAPPEFAPEEPM
jgi:hypothetical protein